MNLGPPSSTTPSNTPRPEPRRTFALAGRSVRLDPRTHAVRGDLADIRLAEQVFAPHYAKAIACRVCWATPLLESIGGAPIAALAEGEAFELLELARGHGWGMAPGHALVGYVDRRALELA